MLSRTRVLITHVSMHFGGVEAQLLTLLHGLEAAQYDVHLALTQKAGERLSEVPEWVAVHDLGCRTWRDLNLLPAPKIAGLVRALAPDICLSYHSYTNLATHVGTRLANRHMPTVGSFAGVVAPGRLDWIRLQILRHMTGLCCVGQGVAASLTACYGKMPQAFVIPNCVDTERVARNARESAGHPWLSDKPCPVLVTVARLVPSKGTDFLLHSFAHLVRGTPARLLIIGDGPERARLTELAQQLHVAERVEFLGYQPNPHRFMSRCDAFVFSSKTDEGLPTVLLEAMVCRIPIITTRYPGVDDAVLDGLTGVIAPARDVQFMAEAIGRVLAAPDLGNRMTEKAYAWVLEEFSKERYVQRYEQLFRALLNGDF